mgnify:CR=1 FL=1
MNNLTTFLRIADKRLNLSAFIFEDGILFRHDPTGKRALVKFADLCDAMNGGNKLDAYSFVMNKIEQENTYT